MACLLLLIDSGALERYSESMRELAVKLVKLIATGLGIKEEEKHYWEAFRRGSFDVRMNCYPVCPQPERVMGIAAHADMSGITMLLECGDVAGLQVLKDGKWVFIPPIDGAIVVNLGQIMEVSLMIYILTRLNWSMELFESNNSPGMN